MNMTNELHPARNSLLEAESKARSGFGGGRKKPVGAPHQISDADLTPPQGGSLRAVLLYSAGHLGSTIVFNILETAPEIEIVGVMRAGSIPVNKKGKSQFFRYIRKIGPHLAWLLAWQVIVQRFILTVTRYLPLWRDSALIPCRILARRKGILTFKCKNVNSAESQKFIESLAPDLIISAYFSQIVEPNILQIPKIGSINIHPGWLPSYRGALSYFWALKNNESKAGVTIHWMDEGLDTGAIIERKKFAIAPGATQQEVLVETALIAGRLIQRTARRILRGKPICPVDVSAEPHKYYTMPTHQQFREYYKGHGYFRIGDILRVAQHGIKKRRMRKLRQIARTSS